LARRHAVPLPSSVAPEHRSTRNGVHEAVNRLGQTPR
jgi:hypothetical protein